MDSEEDRRAATSVEDDGKEGGGEGRKVTLNPHADLPLVWTTVLTNELP